MKRIIETTADGSKTIFIPEMDERYHSKHGALQEAMHVFIDTGLRHFDKDELSILEIGFGTGLNALLSLIEGEKLGKSIHYTGLEAYPVSYEMAMNMDYCSNPQELASFERMHECDWNKSIQITERFSLEKIECLLDDYQPVKLFDCIYFDAFGPRVQDEMWELHVFEKMYDSLNNGGILCTYCAKGSVRRNMIAAGFDVERLPGPPGKREMLRATKP